MRHARRALEPRDPKSVLDDAVDELLARDAKENAPGREQANRHIRSEIEGEKDKLLEEAESEHTSFESMRANAEDRYWRIYPLAYFFGAALIAYIASAVAGRFLIPVNAIPEIGFKPWIAPLLLLAAISILILWWRRRGKLIRDAIKAYDRWRTVLQGQVLRPFILKKRNEQDRDPLDLYVREEFPPRVFEESDPLKPVVTKAMESLRETARNVHAGSLGVSGPRGVGKTKILNTFSAVAEEGGGRNIGMVASAPVDYIPKEFIILLFRRLCETVLRELSANDSVFKEGVRSGLKEDSLNCLEQCGYLHTYTAKLSVTARIKSVIDVALGSGLERAEQPATLPEWTDKFRVYARRVSDAVEDGRLIICIDEIDKILNGERAEAFLNDIKAIFDIPGCLYLVSLSEDAMSSFARRTPTIRSSFDSAFDELIPVGPMGYKASEEMLLKRATGVPRPFIALCYVLAGGLPRELVRTIRSLASVARSSEEMKRDHWMSLELMTDKLIHRELESLRRVSARQLAENAGPAPLLEDLHDQGWPGTKPAGFAKSAKAVAVAARDVESDSNRKLCQDLVVSLSFYATAWEVFAAEGSKTVDLIDCLSSEDLSRVDDLAAARYALWENAELAHNLLENYRSKYEVGEGNGKS